jgi:HPr kinase/phosphorylase
VRGIPARKLYEDRHEELELEFIVEVEEAKLPITTSDVNRPGLALAGFTENFLYERIQILGETEMLRSRPRKRKRRSTGCSSATFPA